MAKPSVRIAAIQFGFAVGVALILGRAAQLQIVDHESWSAEARRTRPAEAPSTIATASPSRSLRSSTTSASRPTS